MRWFIALSLLFAVGCGATRTQTYGQSFSRLEVHGPTARLTAPEGVPTVRSQQPVVTERVMDCYDQAREPSADEIDAIKIQLRITAAGPSVELVHDSKQFRGDFLSQCVQNVMVGVEWTLDGEKEVLIPMEVLPYGDP